RPGRGGEVAGQQLGQAQPGEEEADQGAGTDLEGLEGGVLEGVGHGGRTGCWGQVLGGGPLLHAAVVLAVGHVQLPVRTRSNKALPRPEPGRGRSLKCAVQGTYPGECEGSMNVPRAQPGPSLLKPSSKTPPLFRFRTSWLSLSPQSPGHHVTAWGGAAGWHRASPRGRGACRRGTALRTSPTGWRWRPPRRPR